MSHATTETLAAAQVAIAKRIIRRAQAGGESIDHDALRLAELVLEANDAEGKPGDAGSAFTSLVGAPKGVVS